VSRKTVLLFPSQWAYRSWCATALEQSVEVFSTERQLDDGQGAAFVFGAPPPRPHSSAPLLD
jgi:hypothetical protein